jgi:transposase InsO family protein
LKDSISRVQRCDDVLYRLTEPFVQRGAPQHIRSDNGSKFAAKVGGALGKRLLLDELLVRELFDTLWEVKVLVERWRHTYNRIRPHSALGYRPLAPEIFAPQWP